MKKFFLKNWIWVAFMMFLFLFAGTSHVYAQNSEPGRILFISSYSYGWDTVQIQIEGIKSGVDGKAVVDYEFMDTKRVNDEESAKLFYEGLAYRMSRVEPYDVVIVGDDAALLFAVEHQNDLFADTPIVFEGVNNIELAVELSEDPMITGVVEKLSVEKNIEFGKMLNPHATKVVAILDDSITGQAERESFYSYQEKFPELIFDEINTSQLSTVELRSALKHIDKNTILIYVVMTEDASGKQYTNQESIELIVNNSSVPAMRMVDGGVGAGLLGGNMVSMTKSGEIAAQIAMDIIGGKDCSEIDVITESPNVYCVDEQVMKKFGLDMGCVPEDAVIVNHEPGFWERNEEVLIPGIIILVILLAVGIWIVFDNFKRRKLVGELSEAHKIVETASLHDFLTGIPNRTKCILDIRECIAMQKPCTLMLLDIDNFKHINDNYGHSAGDEALRQLGERLKGMQTEILTPYRYAGDEFIVLIRSTQERIVERSVMQCHQLFDKPFLLHGQKYKVGGSIGVASYPKDAMDVENLISCADAAMYNIKKNGKNGYGYYKGEDMREDD